MIYGDALRRGKRVFELPQKPIESDEKTVVVELHKYLLSSKQAWITSKTYEIPCNLTLVLESIVIPQGEEYLLCGVLLGVFPTLFRRKYIVGCARDL